MGRATLGATLDPLAPVPLRQERSHRALDFLRVLQKDEVVAVEIDHGPIRESRKLAA